MKKIFYNLVLLFFLFSYTSISYSQERIVNGIVTTLENIVVVNAEVKVLSSKEVVLTDTLGNFKISCLLKDKIKISANGFDSQKVKIDENTKELSINLTFKPTEKNLEIAVGYGHIKEKDKSYAISSIKSDDKFGFSMYSNMVEVIVNSSPSIILKNGGIIIRGESSLYGSNSALIILDGKEIDIAELYTLPPMDVKSVDILKGGSAAIYGSRGANGVIIINTKRGAD
jgi:TonB-dependent SusC/RagA subfamily outer membrane receptor